MVGTGELLDTILLLTSDASCTLSIVTQFFCYFFGHISALFIFVIGISRMFYIHNSYRISRNIYKIRIFLYCFGSIFLALLIATVYTIASIFGFYHLVNMIFLPVDFFFFILCLISCLCLYRRVLRHIKNSDKVRCNNNQGQKKQRMHSDLRSMTRMINRIIISLHICYVPYIIVGWVHSLKPDICNETYSKMMSIFLIISLSLIPANSIINSIIFLMANKKARQFILEAFLVSVIAPAYTETLFAIKVALLVPCKS